MRYRVELGVEVPGTSETNAVVTLFLEVEAENYEVAEAAARKLGEAIYGEHNFLYANAESA